MLVTGGTGFVGSAVVRRLLCSGFKVRVLVRPDSPNVKNLEGLNIEVADGDISVRETLGKAMAGCGAVFHLAADYRLWVPKPEPMYRANVDASRWIVEEAVAAGVDRIVYCSSVATLGIEQTGDPATEETASTVDDMVGHYKRSKFLGEEAARQTAEETSAPVVFVNPSAPIGPRDIRPTPTGQMVLDALLGNMPAYIDTGLNVVHVDDVADGILLAYEKGVIGERYILGGENLTLRQIFADLSDLAGCKAPSIRLNPGLLTPIAWVSEQAARITGQEPRIHMDVLRMARKRMFFSSAKAERELGYQSRPAREALTDAAEWFRENDYCR
ncbi:hopanoid-associated sugar epimerase [Rubellicoccus peritrichatus]|uniref:NAD-dependent epimerase/dehydratase family protein n=1 Tax=Rubellicoccus peritrichatus TaxID=3080537 RepID=A0AAQ3QVG1_9BACT|nr:hopanoid-associated sugar epimerase [Puniceicoccus sp. CR14]WOO40787.1 NAD-dependent epimerase/dehydratase family protein [Puniceicoccus sp. CR14]